MGFKMIEKFNVTITPYLLERMIHVYLPNDYYASDEHYPVVYMFEDLGNSALRKYRRNIYPLCSGIPDLIGSYGGLILYKNGSKINYL